jgi:hypothetical protein
MKLKAMGAESRKAQRKEFTAEIAASGLSEL